MINKKNRQALQQGILSNEWEIDEAGQLQSGLKLNKTSLNSDNTISSAHNCQCLHWIPILKTGCLKKILRGGGRGQTRNN